MKTIMVFSNASGGVFLFRQELIRQLLVNYKVIVMVSDTGHIYELRDMGCEVINIPIDRRGKNPIKEFILICKYYYTIKRVHPHFIITYTVKPNIYGGICARVLRIPYASNITGLGTGFQSKKSKKMLSRLYRISLKKSTVVFCENSSIGEELIKNDIVSETKISVLSGAGVNLEHFKYQEYPKESDRVRFLFIGRVMKEKGIDELLIAMRELIKEGVSCSIDIVGGMEEDYKEIFLKYEEEGWFRYHGYQKDVLPYIKGTHCFVLPSWHEGMANTNLECAASGRPIITSNIPGCREAVKDDISGFLCEVKNPKSLYQKMLAFTKLSVQERIKMGMEGRQHMEESFDKSVVVQETMNRMGLFVED